MSLYVTPCDSLDDIMNRPSTHSVDTGYLFFRNARGNKTPNLANIIVRKFGVYPLLSSNILMPPAKMSIIHIPLHIPLFNMIGVYARRVIAKVQSKRLGPSSVSKEERESVRAGVLLFVSKISVPFFVFRANPNPAIPIRPMTGRFVYLAPESIDGIPKNNALRRASSTRWRAIFIGVSGILDEKLRAAKLACGILRGHRKSILSGDAPRVFAAPLGIPHYSKGGV